jgi:hypothetical protein
VRILNERFQTKKLTAFIVVISYNSDKCLILIFMFFVLKVVDIMLVRVIM